VKIDKVTYQVHKQRTVFGTSYYRVYITSKKDGFCQKKWHRAQDDTQNVLSAFSFPDSAFWNTVSHQTLCSEDEPMVGIHRKCREGKGKKLTT
jgi:hypothetical protein